MTSNSASSSSSSTKGSEFLCKIKYYNNLPDVPFEPKLLKYPFDPLRHVKYQPTSLEKNYKFLLHTEPDLGIYIDLIDPYAYNPPGSQRYVGPEDAQLLEETSNGKSQKSRIQALRPSVPWLRKTEYITSTSGDTPKFKGENMETTGGWTRRGTQISTDRYEQIAAIEQTFEAAKEHPKHPHNPELKPVEIFPILPNFDLWSNEYNQVVFDRNPTQPREDLDWSSAIIKGMSESQVAYMIPKKKRKLDDLEEDEQECDWLRAYIYHLKEDPESYFFEYSQDHQCVYYNRYTKKVTLSKTKSSSLLKPEKITLKSIPLGEEESSLREERLNQLLHPEDSLSEYAREKRDLLLSQYKGDQNAPNEEEIIDDD